MIKRIHAVGEHEGPRSALVDLHGLTRLSGTIRLHESMTKNS